VFRKNLPQTWSAGTSCGRFGSSLECVRAVRPIAQVAFSFNSLQVPKDSDVPETVIYFEFHSVGSSDMAVEAETFIMSIAEPVSRQRFIHECVQLPSSLRCRLTTFACTN